MTTSSSGSERSFQPDGASNGMHVDPTRVYVGNFLFNYNEDDVKRLFARYDVLHVKLCTKEQKAFAFVRFSSAFEAKKVIEEMNLKEIDGRQLLVRTMKLTKVGGVVATTSDVKAAHLPVNCHICNHTNDDLDSNCSAMGDYADMPLLEPIKSTSIGLDVVSGIHQENTPTVVISNFPASSFEDDILDLMKDYCPVRCLILLNMPIRMHDVNEKTLAIVYFPNERLASLAKEYIDGQVMGGQTISAYRFA